MTLSSIKQNWSKRKKTVRETVRILFPWIVVLFFVILFNVQINGLIGKLVSNVSFNFDYIWLKVIYAILVLAPTAFLATHVIIPNKHFAINCICLCFLYFLYRYDFISHSEWKYVSLCGVIKYSDVIWLLLVVSIKPYIKLKACKKFRKKEKSSENGIPQFSDNSAIKYPNEDLFGYTTDAENLLNMLVHNKNCTNNGAMIIGLIGKWGQGKTSYLNLMKHCAKCQEDVIIVRVNVWQSHGYEDMAKKFLSAIADKVEDISLKALLNDYAKVIIDAKIAYVSKFLALCCGKGQKQVEDLFDDVCERIGKLGKRIIVQIDDLDRLCGNEIYYTLQFIRNIAGFKNTYFIVAYDDAYITKQLQTLNIESDYLEKIINIPYLLPRIRKNAEIDVVKNELVKSLSIVDNNAENIVTEFMDVIDNCISLRNAKRLTSSIHSGLSALKDSENDMLVDLLDYMLVQYLNQVNPKAYDFLATFNDNNDFIKNRCIAQFWSTYEINKEKGFYPDKKELTDEEYRNERLIRDSRLIPSV